MELEVTLASYGLLEDLSLRACGVIKLCGHGESGRSRFASLIGSTVRDSVAPQSRFS